MAHLITYCLDQKNISTEMLFETPYYIKLLPVAMLTNNILIHHIFLKWFFFSISNYNISQVTSKEVFFHLLSHIISFLLVGSLGFDIKGVWNWNVICRNQLILQWFRCRLNYFFWSTRQQSALLSGSIEWYIIYTQID